MNIQKRSLGIAVGFLLIGVLVGTIVSYAASNGTTFTISQGIYPGAPSYTIWKEGSIYYAKNAYGLIDYSGADASTVIQAAINALTSGGKILVKNGIYELYAGINLNVADSTCLVAESDAVVFKSFVAPPIVAIIRVTKDYCSLENFRIEGTGAVAYGIWIEKPDGVVVRTVVRNVHIRFLTGQFAIFTHNALLTRFDNVQIYGGTNEAVPTRITEYGIWIEGGTCPFLTSCWVAWCKYYGIILIGVQGGSILGGASEVNKGEDLYIGEGCSGIFVSGIDLERPEPDATVPYNIRIFGQGITVEGCFFYGANRGFYVGPTAKGVKISGNSFVEQVDADGFVENATDVLIENNRFSKNIIYDWGTRTIIRGNYNYVTVSSGTATGTSPITVAHGLAGQATYVILGATGATALKTSWANINATHFYIYHDSGGSSTITWYAEYKP